MQSTAQVRNTFYVATNGSDAWSGRLPDPNRDKTDGPFATLRRARDAVRASNKDRPAAPVSVQLRGGTYVLEETLVLTSEDSGTRTCPVTWCAYAGEKPILSAGRVVTGWKPYKGHVLVADAPEAIRGLLPTRQLFYKGQRQPRARWPKADPSNPIRSGWAFPESPVADFGTCAFHFRPDTFPRRWAKPYQGEVRIFVGHGWCSNLVPIRSIDYDRRILWLARESMQADCPPWFMRIALGQTSRFAVENILEELSEPGEWCFDSSQGLLYFWPPDGPVEHGDVVAPGLDCLLRFRDAEWITVAGLTFTHTTTGDNYHRNRLEGCGAMFPQQGWPYCGEAVHLRGTSHCTIERCHFDQVGGNAIYLERDNHRNVIRRNEIAYAGANGVALIGDRAFHPTFNEVVDNRIHHAGAIINYVAGVFMGVSDGNLIAHNSIHDMPHHAVNLGSNGLGRNYVEHNEIRRVCLEIADTGAVNCWMDVPGPWIEAHAERSGHVIRHNLIVDVPGAVAENGQVVDDRSTRGIYLDDCTSNCLVFGNVIVRAGMGFQVHGGKHNVIENNVVVDCRMGLHGCDHPPLRPGNAHLKGMFRGNRFVRNIVQSVLPDAIAYSFHEWTDNVMERCDENLFHLPAAGCRVDWHGRTDGITNSSFDDWRAMGFDRNSIVADPLFVSPGTEDFHLRDDSPALKLGFIPIDVSEAGIRDKG